ncbi:MAG: methyltransferase domain-containing protein [Actinobacteria bacterium]|jgi:trans-aconitate methyltransferase|nr:MAG: methyltransferase domain-containing protein [Actinomycetota bacterium]
MAEAGGSYRWDAADYRDSSSQQKKWGRELLTKLRLGGGERILDIGCGDGKLTAEIAELIPSGHVVGIDSSPEMIAYARSAFPRESHPNVSWEVMDARELSFEGGFDIAFSNAVLHWVSEQPRVLQGVKRSLEPGGKVLFQMGGKGNAARVVQVLASLLSREEWGRYFSDFTVPYRFCAPREYEGWLREAGLKPIRIELVTKDMTHEGPGGLAAWIRTTWLPFTQRIPEGMRDDFIAEMVDGYIRLYPPDAEGMVHVDAVRLEVEAESPLHA